MQNCMVFDGRLACTPPWAALGRADETYCFAFAARLMMMRDADDVGMR